MITEHKATESIICNNPGCKSEIKKGDTYYDNGLKQFICGSCYYMHGLLNSKNVLVQAFVEHMKREHFKKGGK